MRINVVIDDEFMGQAMVLSKLKTKKEVIERALQEFVAVYSRKNLMDLRGKISFDDNYDYKAARGRCAHG